MPIYIMLANIFFEKNVGLVVFSIYLLGITIFVLVGLILNKIFLIGEADDFLMELPAYRLPIFKNLLKNVFEKAKDYLNRIENATNDSYDMCRRNVGYILQFFPAYHSVQWTAR